MSRYRMQLEEDREERRQKRQAQPKQKPERVLLICLECGKTFSRSGRLLDVECPRCHGVDIEPAL